MITKILRLQQQHRIPSEEYELALSQSLSIRRACKISQEQIPNEKGHASCISQKNGMVLGVA